MMQPVDIKTTSFGKGLFGYKKADVDGHIDIVYRAYDELFKEVNKLREENERLNKVVEENRMKIFEMEKQISEAAPKQEKKSGASAKVEESVKEAKEETNASKFFKQAEEDAALFGGDDDEVFVGEIEDNRKTKNKVMIGDGEEESADDFEFL